MYLTEAKMLYTERSQLSLPDDDMKSEAKELGEVLNNRSVKMKLGQLTLEIEGKLQQLQVVDLSDEQGVRNALKLQGEVTGMKRCLDLFLEGSDK